MAIEDSYNDWAQTKDPQSLHRLLGELSGTISSGVTSYAGSPSPVVASHARLLALQAIKSFDPKKKVQLQTHVMNQLQPLRRYSTQATQAVKTPEKRTQELNYLKKTEDEFYAAHGREPTLTELADTTGLSARRINHLRSVDITSMSESQLTGDEGGLQMPGVQSADPADAWADYVYLDQNLTDKKIMEWKMGLYGSPVLSNQEIAAKLGISPSAVTQRATRIAGVLEQGRQFTL